MTKSDHSTLEAAAHRYLAGLKPGSAGDRASILGLLTSRYPAGNTTPKEAEARFKLLVADLAPVPIDILDAACRKCALECKFMPTAAEIMERVRPLLGERQTRAGRIRQLVTIAANTEDPQGENVSLEQAAAILAEVAASTRVPLGSYREKGDKSVKIERGAMPPPGGYAYRDSLMEHSFLTTRVNEINAHQVKKGREPMTEAEGQALYDRMAASRKANGADPRYS